MEDVEGEDHDHPHQRSFWFTHGNVNGYDFWASDPLNSPNPKFGKIGETGRGDRRRRPRPSACSGPRDDWLGPDGKKLCDDERVFRFYDTEAARVIDVDVTIKATDGPVTFGDTKEGMFGLRLASSMDVKRKHGRQDRQRRGHHRHRRLGQGLALGRLHRARRRRRPSASPS